MSILTRNINNTNPEAIRRVLSNTIYEYDMERNTLTIDPSKTIREFTKQYVNFEDLVSITGVNDFILDVENFDNITTVPDIGSEDINLTYRGNGRCIIIPGIPMDGKLHLKAEGSEVVLVGGRFEDENYNVFKKYTKNVHLSGGKVILYYYVPVLPNKSKYQNIMYLLKNELDKDFLTNYRNHIKSINIIKNT